jgi:hypothetical protein
MAREWFIENYSLRSAFSEEPIDREKANLDG